MKFMYHKNCGGPIKVHFGARCHLIGEVTEDYGFTNTEIDEIVDEYEYDYTCDKCGHRWDIVDDEQGMDDWEER